MTTRGEIKTGTLVVAIIALVIGAVIGGAAGYLAVPTKQVVTTETVTATPATVTVTATAAPATTAAAGPISWTDWVSALKARGGETIKFLSISHTSIDALRAMMDQFTAETGIKVQHEIVTYDVLNPKTLTAAADYDVIMVDSFWIPQFAPAKVLLPLDNILKDPQQTPKEFNYDDFHSSYRAMFTFNGQILAIPLAGESRFLMYNKDIFAAFNKQPPKSYEELLDDARFFQGKTYQGHTIYGISIRNDAINALSGFMSIGLYTHGDGFWDPKTGKILYNSTDSIKGLKYYLELCKNGPPGALANTGYEEAFGQFMSGNTAMSWEATAPAGWVEDPTKSKVVGKVGYIAPFGDEKHESAALAGWGLAVSAPSKKVWAASAFIMWMLGKPNSALYLSKGGVASRTSDMLDPSLQAKYPWFEATKLSLDMAYKQIQLADAGVINHWIPQEPKFGEFYGEVSKQITRAETGEITAEQAAQLGAQEIAKVLAGKMPGP